MNYETILFEKSRRDLFPTTYGYLTSKEIVYTLENGKSPSIRLS